MKQQNEHGMALLSVLLIIVVFTVIGVVLMNLTVTNSKQVNITEKDMQAVDISEMGITYYKNAFIAHASDKIEQAIGNTIKEINQINAANLAASKKKEDVILLNPENPNTVLQYLGRHLKQNDVLLTIPPVTLDINPNYSFRITDQLSDPSQFPSKIKVSFTSYERGLKDRAKIFGTIELDTKELIKVYVNQGKTTGGKGTDYLKMFLTMPQGLTKCDFSNQLQTNCSYNSGISELKQKPIQGITAAINGKISLKSGNTALKSSFLYINGLGDFNNMNGGITGTKLYIGSDGEFGNINSEGIHSSTLDIRGNANFNKNVQGNIIGSTINVGQNLSFMGHVGTIQGSTIYVKNNLSFSKHVGTINNSKICVGGTIFGLVLQGDAWEEINNGTKYKCIFTGGNTNSPPSPTNLSSAVANKMNLHVKYD